MKVLFICKGNVARSQMAPVFFNKLSKKHTAMKAGTQVNEHDGETLHPFVIKCMAELSYDLSNETRIQLTEEMVEEADKIIAICKKEVCPDYLLESDKVEFWDIPDAVHKDYDFHVKIRDEILERVKKLVEELEK